MRSQRAHEISDRSSSHLLAGPNSAGPRSSAFDYRRPHPRAARAGRAAVKRPDLCSTISVRGVRTPEPDLHKLARAVIRMAEEQDRQQDDRALAVSPASATARHSELLARSANSSAPDPAAPSRTDRFTKPCASPVKSSRRATQSAESRSSRKAPSTRPVLSPNWDPQEPSGPWCWAGTWRIALSLMPRSTATTTTGVLRDGFHFGINDLIFGSISDGSTPRCEEVRAS